MRLLADSLGNKLWDPTLPEMLSFITRPGTRGAWFNLRYDIECILKTLEPKQMAALLGVTDDKETVAHDHAMRYIPKKCFTLRHGKSLRGGTGISHHYDMAQFFNSSLNKAAVKYLDDKKDDSGIDRAKLGSDITYWKGKEDRIERYCVHDAALTARLARLWDGWADSLNVDFSHPISPAFVAKRYAESEGWPVWSEQQHATLGPVAWQAYAGGRFESRLKGTMKLWSYDIRSAYPSIMVELPSTETPWRKTSEQGVALDAAWGFVEATVRVGNVPWGPLPVRNRNGVITFPKGNLGTRWMTLWEFEKFREHPDIKLDFKRAWVGEDNGQRPLAWLRDMYAKRIQMKNAKDPKQAVVKVMLNSTYGATMEKRPVEWQWRLPTVEDDILLLAEKGMVKRDRDGNPRVKDGKTWKAGPLFNPIWGAHITAGTRLKLWDVISNAENDVASVATDGILSRRPVRGLATAEGGLGTWEDGGAKSGVIVGNGLYQREGEAPKRRGFGEPLQGFDWLAALSGAARGATVISVADERPLHPGEVMRSKKWSLADVGMFREISRRIDLNADEKRVFPKVTAHKLLTGIYEGKLPQM